MRLVGQAQSVVNWTRADRNLAARALRSVPMLIWLMSWAQAKAFLEGCEGEPAGRTLGWEIVLMGVKRCGDKWHARSGSSQSEGSEGGRR